MHFTGFHLFWRRLVPWFWTGAVGIVGLVWPACSHLWSHFWPPSGRKLQVPEGIEYLHIRRVDGFTADSSGIDLLEHVSPIEWENVVLYGQYLIDVSLIR